MRQEDVKSPLQNNNSSWQDVRSLPELLTGLSSDQGMGHGGGEAGRVSAQHGN